MTNPTSIKTLNYLLKAFELCYFLSPKAFNAVQKNKLKQKLYQIINILD